MNRSNALCLFSALIALVAACGSVVDTAGFDGMNGKTSASSGAASTTGGAGGESIDAGGMCNAPPPPSANIPDTPGCYVNNMGSGWVPVPCSCDLWLENTMPAQVTAGIQLLVTPPDQAPTLDGAIDVEIAFDDPDASYYATWTKQAGNGEAFTVTSDAGTTTVRMGESSLTLLPVPVAACKTRKAVAHVSGSNDSPTLSIHAVLDDGMPFATTDAKCFNPPPL